MPKQQPVTNIDAIVTRFLECDATDNHRRGPRSVTGCVTIEGQRYFCKTSDESLANEAELLAQCRTLSCADTPGVCAVPLIGYDAPRNVLITEPVDGGNLFNRLWNATDPWRLWEVSHRRFDSLFVQLARWLRAFHALPLGETTPRKTRSAATEHLHSMIDRRLDTVRSVGDSGLSDDQLDAVTRIAAQLARSDGWADQPLAVIHGDLTPVNILAESDTSIVIIDFGNVRHGYALEDIARLWISIWEIAQTTPWRKRWLSSAGDVLLKGMALPGDIVTTDAFAFMRLWNAVTRLHEAATTAKQYRPPAAKLHRALLTHHVRYLRDLAANVTPARRAA